jgi:hypothetical protein
MFLTLSVANPADTREAPQRAGLNEKSVVNLGGRLSDATVIVSKTQSTVYKRDRCATPDSTISVQ